MPSGNNSNIMDYNTNPLFCHPKLIMITYKSTLLLLLSLCTLQGLSLDYHVSSQIALNLTNVVNINAIGTRAVAVLSETSKLTILSQLDLKNKLSEYTTHVDPSQIKANDFGVVINEGGSLSIRKSDYRLSRFDLSQSGLWSNMILVGDSVLVAAMSNIPTLIKLNLPSMKISQQTYEYSLQLPFDSIVLHNPGNGQILVGFGPLLMILQSETLAVKQTLTKESVINAISSHYDKEQNSWTIFVGCKLLESYRWYQLIYSQQSQQYQEKVAFVSSGTTRLHFTSRSSAVTADKYRAYYYLNLHNIADIGFEGYQNLEGGLKVLSVSYDETTFLIRCGTPLQQNYYYVYGISPDYSIAKKIQLVIENQSTVIDKAMATSDDNYTFMQVRYGSKARIGLLNVDQPLDFVGGDNQLDFHLFDVQQFPAESIATFVTLSTNSSTSKFYLQLRDGRKTVKHTLQLLSNNPLTLLGNIKWGQYFVVNQLLQPDLSNLHLFQIANQQLANTTLSLTVASAKIYSCGKYLVVWLQPSNRILCYNYLDFSLARQLNFKDQVGQVLVQKSTMLVYMTQINVQTVFDLSDQITDKGSYSVQDNGNYYGNPLFIILPERQLVYQASISKDTTRAGSKVFYNFSRPTLSSSRVYVQDGMAQVNPIYYINQADSCNFIFYLYKAAQESYLRRYSECDDSTSNYPLPNAPKVVVKLELSLSSDSKYMIISSYFYFKDATNASIEVRRVDDPARVVSRQNISMSKDSLIGNMVNVDVVDQTLIACFHDFVHVSSLDQMVFAERYQLESITAFGITGQRMIALAGLSTQPPNQWTMKVLDLSSEEMILNVRIPSAARLVELSEGAIFVAAYLSDSILHVWDTLSKQLIVSRTFAGLNRIKFINRQTLLLQYSNTFELLQLGTVSTTIESNLFISDYSGYFIDFSVDGSIRAEITAQTTLRISTGSENFTFEAPSTNERLVGLTFLSNNTILAVTDMGTLFALSPTPCQTNYINTNGICRCEDPFLEVDGKCSSMPGSLPVWAIILITISSLALVLVVLLILRRITRKKLLQSIYEEKQAGSSDYSQLRSQLTEPKYQQKTG